MIIPLPYFKPLNSFLLCWSIRCCLIWLLSGFLPFMLPPRFFFSWIVLCLLWIHGNFLAFESLYPLSALPEQFPYDSSYSLDLRWNVINWEVFPDCPVWKISHFELLFSLCKHLLFSPTLPPIAFGYLVYPCVSLLICVLPVSHSLSLKPNYLSN